MRRHVRPRVERETERAATPVHVQRTLQEGRLGLRRVKIRHVHEVPQETQEPLAQHRELAQVAKGGGKGRGGLIRGNQRLDGLARLAVQRRLKGLRRQRLEAILGLGGAPSVRRVGLRLERKPILRGKRILAKRLREGLRVLPPEGVDAVAQGKRGLPPEQIGLRGLRARLAAREEIGVDLPAQPVHRVHGGRRQPLGVGRHPRRTRGDGGIEGGDRVARHTLGLRHGRDGLDGGAERLGRGIRRHGPVAVGRARGEGIEGRGQRGAIKRGTIRGKLLEKVLEPLAFRRVGAEILGGKPLERGQQAVEGSQARLEPVDGAKHIRHADAPIAVGIKELRQRRAVVGGGQDDPVGARERVQMLDVGARRKRGLGGAGGLEKGVAIRAHLSSFLVWPYFLNSAQNSAMRRSPSSMFPIEQA